MEHENLKRISLDDVKNLPDGTNVYVECIGPNWMGPEEEMKSWNIKGKDGMYYSDRSEISFQYDFDNIAEGMEIACYVGKYGCECCMGDEALYWKNDKNNIFIDSHGNMLINVDDKRLTFKANYCPACGKKFNV